VNEQLSSEGKGSGFRKESLCDHELEAFGLFWKYRGAHDLLFPYLEDLSGIADFMFSSPRASQRNTKSS
jgi:hypothetical protein